MTKPFIGRTGCHVWSNWSWSKLLDLILMIGDDGYFRWCCYHRCCDQSFHSNSSSQAIQCGRLLSFRCGGGSRCWGRAVSFFLWLEFLMSLPSAKENVCLPQVSSRTLKIRFIFNCGRGFVLAHYLFDQVVSPFLLESSYLLNEENGSLVVACFGGVDTRYGVSDINTLHRLSAHRPINIMYAETPFMQYY